GAAQATRGLPSRARTPDQRHPPAIMGVRDGHGRARRGAREARRTVQRDDGDMSSAAPGTNTDAAGREMWSENQRGDLVTTSVLPAQKVPSGAASLDGGRDEDCSLEGASVLCRAAAAAGRAVERRD